MTHSTLRYPSDEFEWPRHRQEAHPTIESYLATRSEDELAALIWNETYRRNVFGTYRGTVGEHSLAILEEMRRRGGKARKLVWVPLGITRTATTPIGDYKVWWENGEADICFRDARFAGEASLEKAFDVAQAHFDDLIAKSTLPT